MPTKGDPYQGLDPAFAAAVKRMVAASGGRLTLVSGYRSPQRQAQLYAAAIKKYGSAKAARKWVAPPGHSNHGRGVAYDLGGDLKWAHANAAKFGLYFPMGHEPWHVELQGTRGGKMPKQTQQNLSYRHDGHNPKLARSTGGNDTFDDSRQMGMDDPKDALGQQMAAMIDMIFGEVGGAPEEEDPLNQPQIEVEPMKLRRGAN